MAEIRGMMDKLGQMLSHGKQQRIDLSAFMLQCQELFEECSACLESGTAREKDTLLKDLVAMQETMESDIDSLAKEMGKSTEHILSYVENPNNYPEDAWQTMQKTWRRITTMKTKKKSKDNKDTNGPLL